jgi:hypothetical protein
MAATAWPAGYCQTNCTGSGMDGLFASTDVSDDDGDSNPGITADPKSDPCSGGGACTYTYPPTTVSLFSIPPLADKVFIASRNELQISGTRMNSCTQGTGTVKVTLFDNHVIGCHIHNPAAACTSAAVSFLDQNRTIYGPTASSVASSSNPITGTAKVAQMAQGATCAQVRAAL